MRKPLRDSAIRIEIETSPAEAANEPCPELYEEIEDMDRQLREAAAQLDAGMSMAVADCLDQVMRAPEGQEARLLALLELAGLKATGPH